MTRTRHGFTLVELLVVMSLIIVLAGITVAVAESGAFASQKVVSAADRASGWLLGAKQRSLRDGRPRGVRFLLTQEPGAQNTGTPNWQAFSFASREAQLIEMPDAWSPNPTGLPTGPRLVLLYTLTGGTLTQQMFFASTQSADLDLTTSEFGQRVADGDLIVLPLTGATYRIAKIDPVATTGLTKLDDGSGGVLLGRELTLGMVGAAVFPDLGAANSPPPAPGKNPMPTASIYSFAFQPKARPLVGEPLLQLTGNTVIDVRSRTFVTNAGGNPSPLALVYAPEYPPPNPVPATTTQWPPTSTGLRLQPAAALDPASPTVLPQFFDVLFAPSGQVMDTPDAEIVLWLRDPEKVPHPRLADVGQFPAGNPGLDQGATFDAAGPQVLVSVVVRTGLIKTEEVTKGSDPYAATKDGLKGRL